MGELKYISSTSGEIVELDGPLTFIDQGLALRRSARSYNLGWRSVTLTRGASAAKCTGWTRSEEEADRIDEITKADCDAGVPGIMKAGKWEQQCYAVDMTPTRVGYGSVDFELVIILLEGSWRAIEHFSLFPAAGDATGTKIHPYPYPYTYAAEYGVRFIDIKGTSKLPFVMTIFGFAVSPQIHIGGNLYKFDITIPEGGYLLVDARNDPVVTLVDAAGLKTDAFKCAFRGDGEGCGSYAFEKIPTGKVEARWNDSFGFDLDVYHERGGIPYAACNR